MKEGEQSKVNGKGQLFPDTGTGLSIYTKTQCIRELKQNKAKPYRSYSLGWCKQISGHGDNFLRVSCMSFT